MKKYLIAVLAITAVMAFTVPAFTADQMLDTKVKQAITKLDKNGKEYTRLIISEVKDMNGVKYSIDTAVMCFGDTVVKAKTLKTGDSFKAIVAENEYKGRLNYNLITFVQPDTKK